MGKPLDDIFEKRAEGDIVSGAIGSLTAGAMTGKPTSPSTAVTGGFIGEGIKQLFSTPTPEKAEQEAVSELFDPQHDAELARIKTQAMLSEFMSVDPVISSYDPEEVASAYNQVTQLAPRVAQQPAVMRGLLRKMLQQSDSLEPFEAEQLAKIEQTLKSVAEPSERLMAPKV